MGFDLGSMATNAVSSVKNVFSSSGPAAGLAGSIKDAAGAISGAIGIGTSLLGIFNKNLVTFSTKLPAPNILHNYATYNYILGLGVLSPNEVNFPDSTYLAGNAPLLILKDGSVDPNNRVKTPYGRFEFFMTELTFEGYVGNSRKTGNTNATNIQFKVVEPYSMGLFMTSMQQAAFELGYSNFRDAPFLITIEFRGNDQQGIPQKIPGTSRYLPIKIQNISMNVTGAGSTYSISAFAWNDQSHSKTVATLKSDVTVTGKTVQEMLQTGENSLQAALNKRSKQQEKDQGIKQADEYLIIFPNEIASDASNSSGGEKAESSAGATQPPAGAANSDLFKKLGVAQSSKNKTLVQNDGECNAIGKAKMGYDLSRRGDAPMGKVSEVYDPKKEVMVRANQKIDPAVTDFKFPQNSDIASSINNVILNSEFAIKALDSSTPLSSEGMRDWWRIETQTYTISSTPDPVTGKAPLLHVYRVVPYKAHASRMTPANIAAPGFDQLKKQAVKEYNYIYTGKNVDIIRFNIDIANGFQQMMTADGGTRNADVQLQDDNAVGSEEGGSVKQPAGTAPPKPGEGLPAQVSYSKTKTSTDGKGGGGTETAGVRVAKLFHDALINGKDLQNLELEIVGDPYFLFTSGLGNYTAASSNYSNLNAEGTVDYQTGEVDCVVNFRTPIDINQSTGLYDFGNTVAVQQFSGLYKLTTVKNSFKGGQFTQTLNGFRRYGQENQNPADPSKLITSTENAPEVSDYSETSSELRTPEEIQASKDLGDFAG